ncbi:MAG TPA: hypothetical protein VLR90_05740, partial [Blastocatellia bacterium]|nr:hypothetical protein [Blastocatellia bacterium]
MKTRSLHSHILRLTFAMFVLALMPLVAQAQGENNETRLICHGDPIPTGYIRTDIIVDNSDPRCANNPGGQIPNMAVIRRFYTKTTGFGMVVCSNQSLSPR